MTRLSYGPIDKTIKTQGEPSQAPAPGIIDLSVPPQASPVDEQITAWALLLEVHEDSGFRNLFQPLQDKIEALLNNL